MGLKRGQPARLFSGSFSELPTPFLSPFKKRRMAGMQRNAFSERINLWLRSKTFSSDLTPLETINSATNLFLDDLDRFDLEIDIPEQQFKKYMCEAICAFYVAHQYQKKVVGPPKSDKLPRGWTDTAENVWYDYIYTWYFTDDYWTEFWETVGAANWEVELPRWREFFQTALLIYLFRDATRLLDDGLLVETRSGRFVAPHELEEEEATEAADE